MLSTEIHETTLELAMAIRHAPALTAFSAAVVRSQRMPSRRDCWPTSASTRRALHGPSKRGSRPARSRSTASGSARRPCAPTYQSWPTCGPRARSGVPARGRPRDQRSAGRRLCQPRRADHLRGPAPRSSTARDPGPSRHPPAARGCSPEPPRYPPPAAVRRIGRSVRLRLLRCAPTDGFAPPEGAP